MNDNALSFCWRAAQLQQEGVLPSSALNILNRFHESYCAALQRGGHDNKTYQPLLLQFLSLIEQQLRTPHTFALYHQQIIQPFNFHQFGLDFVKPLVDPKGSKVIDVTRFDSICQALDKKENVVLFANHQTELDPQLIDLLLQTSHPSLAQQMIFVAGDRVIRDPLAVPFSLGRNLICIYSKKHIDHPIEQRAEKLLHNQRSLAVLTKLLSQGGKCLYVAPSGGRDRKNEQGNIAIAPFDPHSIEMMYLLAMKSQKICHFYPLALKTYDILPPPQYVEKDLGEWRAVNYASIYLCLGEKIHREHLLAPYTHLEKSEKRQLFAASVWKQLCEDYQNF